MACSPHAKIVHARFADAVEHVQTGLTSFHLLDAKMPARGDGNSCSGPDCQQGAPEECTARGKLWQKPEALNHWGLQSSLVDPSLPDELILCWQLGWQLCQLLALCH